VPGGIEIEITVIGEPSRTSDLTPMLSGRPRGSAVMSQSLASPPPAPD